MPRPRMPLTALLLVAAVAGVLAGSGSMLRSLSAGAAGPGTTERVSVDSAGAQGNSDSSWSSISADGRFVAFSSGATNLVPGDTNNTSDVFVRERATGATERVSVDSAGAEGNSNSYYQTSISADGRYVAFSSTASNLVPGDTNGTWDVFVRDRATGATERVSVDSAGAQGNSSGSYQPSISSDGRYVAFSSTASNLVPGDTNGIWDVFVRDRATGATERVSVDSAGAQGNNDSSWSSISADAHYVAFRSDATNLVPGDTNGTWDVFVRDRATGATERVSVDSAGAQGNSSSYYHPSISADGRYVAFNSFATNLVPGDTNGAWDVFVRDRAAGATERVSVDSAGTQGNSSIYYQPSISAGGRFVAFSSDATNLVPGDTNGVDDVFVRDRCPDGSCGGTPPPVPIVIQLVHGYDSNSEATTCGMESLENYFKGLGSLDGHPVYTNCTIYRTREGVAAGANTLHQSILRVKQYRGISRVDVVAHSMGGLVARYCIQYVSGCKDNIRSLTMIGTPNLGTKRGDQACFFKRDQGACDLRSVKDNPLLKKMNANPGPPAGVGYHVLMGNQSRVNSFFGGPNDCVVSVASAFGLGFPNDTPFTASHTGSAGIAQFGGCDDPGEMDYGPLRLRARDLIRNAAAGVASVNIGAGLGAATEAIASIPVDSAIAFGSGVVGPGQVIDVPVAVPDGGATATFIFRAPTDPSVELTFELLRPGQIAVGTGDADVTYESGQGFGGFVETHYTIANPVTGAWTMRLTGTTVPETGWPYDVQALVPGGISVTASTGAGHYDVGQPIDLSAEVAINNVPYVGATVSATLTKPDNTATTVALVDAGGGAYSGSFADTAACGLYQVAITAEGSDNGTPFSRQDRTIAIAGVPGNVILDPCDADSDDDGLSDAAEIDVYGANPANPDTDDDLAADAVEVTAGTEPSNPDSDADGVLDGFELFVSATDPLNADTDGDGYSDGDLVPSPLIGGPDNCALVANADQLNTDRLPITTPGIAPIDTTIAYDDALGDACDPDDDNDGIGDIDEPAGCNASGPLDALLFDTDGDRTGDAAECALGSNPANPASKPQRPMPNDTDGDGLPDALETAIGSNPAVIDTDGDGINDGIEYRGYNTSPSAPDSDNDACNDDTEITDITGSRKTDIVDIFLAAQSVGMTDRPNFDISKDGAINIVDLFLIAANVTQGFCPPQ